MYPLADPIRGFCKQGVRGSSPLGSTEKPQVKPGVNPEPAAHEPALVADVVADPDRQRTLVAVGRLGETGPPRHGKTMSTNTGDAIRVIADALLLQSATLARIGEAMLALSEQPAEPAVTPSLLSIDQAATALGVGRRRIYQLIEAGDLRSVHLGTRHLIPAAEIERATAPAAT